ncbi:hypothetical protein GCM10011367_05970 [Marinicauda pacifica]|nr:efflux RND transporter periplasmic adaptor subunit [Marinicauda sp. Alg238-R41]GGE34348.1 hypothetical protein GCM10011367_05970 [Marinicauda pacifica]
MRSVLNAGRDNRGGHMQDRVDKLQSLSIDRSGEEQRGGGVPVVAVLVLALVAAGLGLAAGWLLSPEAPQGEVRTDAPADASGTTAPPVAAASAPRSRGLVASGYVVARRQATVSAEITGRIRDVLIEEGARVEAGEVLARLDDDRARLDLELLETQARAAHLRVDALQAQLAEARTVSDRARRLQERGFGPVAAATAAQAQVDSLSAQLSASQADAAAADVRVANQRDLVERHVVRAPFAGVVIAKNAQVGEILSPVSAGGGFTRTGVATLVDMGSLELEIDVNEGQIQRIRPGQPVEAVLDAYPDWDVPAVVEAIIPTADRSRATIQVRVRFLELDPRLLPDMAARVTFIENGE